MKAIYLKELKILIFDYSGFKILSDGKIDLKIAK